MKKIGINIDKKQVKIISIENGKNHLDTNLPKMENFSVEGGGGTKLKEGLQKIVHVCNYLEWQKYLLSQLHTTKKTYFTLFTILWILICYFPVSAQFIVSTKGNTNLECIAVSNVANALNAKGWKKENVTQFSANCNKVSINDQDLFMLDIFPNPLRGRILNVTLNERSLFSLFSIDGKMLIKERELKQGKNEIPLQAFVPNLYIVQIVTKQRNMAHKLIIN